MWEFLKLQANAPAPVTTYWREDGDIYEYARTPQYYEVRVRSNITYEDRNGTSGYFVTPESFWSVRQTLEKRMNFNADWDVILVCHKAKETCRHIDEFAPGAPRFVAVRAEVA